MPESLDTRAHLQSQLDEAAPRWSEQQFKSFAVLCYRTIESFLTDEATSAVDWIISDLQAQQPERSFEAVLLSLQWNVMDLDAARANENRFSFEVLKLLEGTPLEAAKAAVTAVSSAADLQALYAQSQPGHSEAIAEFNKRMALSQIVGLFQKIETDPSYKKLLLDS